MRNGKDITQQNNAKYMAKESAVKRAEVIVSTSIAAASGYLKDYSFTNVLIDEASQAHELSCLVPIMHGCEQLVLVGDHCQLPPSISSEAAKSDGLDVSLYDRLVKKGVPCFLLDTQYRMHPKIAEFSSDAFYAGRVKNGVPASDRPTLRGINWPVPGCGVVFINRGIQWGGEKSDGVSKSNEDEANLVATVVRDVLAQGEIGINDIGVISPYSAQVRLLRRKLSMYRNQGRGGGGVKVRGGGGGGYSPMPNGPMGSRGPSPMPMQNNNNNNNNNYGGNNNYGNNNNNNYNQGGYGGGGGYNQGGGYGGFAPTPEPPAENLEISSVDGFQGREKKLIIFSAVRCNSNNSVGFLADWRRINVAITRAQQGLVFIGDATTLMNDRRSLKPYLDYCLENGFIDGVAASPGSYDKAATQALAEPTNIG